MRVSFLTAVVTAFFIAAAGPVLASGGRPQATSEPPAQEELTTAPDFTLYDAAGKSYTLSQLRGKVVVLNFWATWCPPCKAEMPSMERLNQKMQGRDFIMLAVNIEEGGVKAVAPFLKAHPHSFSVLYDADAKVQNLYQVYRFPETFLIGKDGTIAERVLGAIEWDDARVIEYIENMLRQ